MKKLNLIPLILGTILVICGAFIFGFALGEADWDIKNLATVKYETNTYEITESFTSLHINCNTADVHLLPTDDEKCIVVAHEEENNKHNVTVNAGVLCIDPIGKDTIRFGLNFDSPKITVYLPEQIYGNLEINNDTGDILIDSSLKFDNIRISLSTGDVRVTDVCCSTISLIGTTGDVNILNAIVFGNLSIERNTGNVSLSGVKCDGSLTVTTSTGRIKLSDVECVGKISISVSTGDTSLINATCADLSSNGTTGEVNIENVIVSGKATIARSSGDIKLESFDAAEISIHTNSGDVKGSLISSKVFVTKTDTGRVSVPETTSGGICKITTDTGDIIITIE
jgi:DUF4097 and DUF4098 domain-containing protein YvlB